MKTLFRAASALAVFALTAAAHAAPVALRAVPSPVPEIDPSLAAGGLVLITGGIAILRSRRARKTV